MNQPPEWPLPADGLRPMPSPYRSVVSSASPEFDAPPEPDAAAAEQVPQPQEVPEPAEALCQFRELAAVIAVAAAHDHDDVTFLRQVQQCLLSLLGRLANRIDEAHVGAREAAAHGGDQLENRAQRLRRLRHDTQARPAFQLVQVGLTQHDAVFIKIADQAAHLDMAGLADDDRVPAFRA